MHSSEIEERKKKIKVTPLQKRILVGLLLGDGCLYSPNNGKDYRLQIENSLNQKDYVNWIYRVFKDWVRTPPRVIKKKIGEKTYLNYGFTTLSLAGLRFFGHHFYNSERRKRVPKTIKKLLTLEGLAVWFMDDGSRKSKRHKTYNIHALDFPKKDLRLLQKSLKEKFGIETRLHCQGKYKRMRWRIYVVSKSAKRFREMIEPFILPLFRYKLG